MSNTYSECVFVALGIQHAMSIFHLWSVRLYHIFPHYLINGAICRKKFLNIKRVFLVSVRLLSETFLFLRRIQRDIIIKVLRSSCKVLVILVRFK
jgi:hypothetical protein